MGVSFSGRYSNNDFARKWRMKGLHVSDAKDRRGQKGIEGEFHKQNDKTVFSSDR